MAIAEHARGSLARVLRNVASILLGDAAGDVLIGYALALAAISLGPSGFGTFSEARAFMDLFEAASALGLTDVALRFAAARGGCDGTLRGTILGLRTSAAAVAALVGMVVAFLTGRGDLWPLLLACAVGMLLEPANVAALLPFQWHQTVHRRIAVPLLIGVVRLGGTYVVARGLPTPLGFQLAAVVAAGGAVLLNSWWAHRLYPDALRFDRALARQLLRVSWPLGVFGFVCIVYSRAGYFFLRACGPDEQGQYAAADGLTRPMIAVASAFFVSMMPTVSAMAIRSDYVGLRALYRRTLLGILAALAPVLGLAWFFSAWLLHRFAPAFSGAIWPFRGLALGTSFIFLNIVGSLFLTALGKFRILMLVALLDLAVYLVLSSQLIPAYGAFGAAMTTTFMEGVNVVVDFAIIMRLLTRGSRRGANPSPASEPA
jgi:O-antigen/teichoic acid export membrane protein